MLDFGRLALEPDVARLDVTVDLPVPVCRRQAGRDFPAHPKRQLQSRLGRPGQASGQRFAFQHRHGNEGNAVVLAHVEDRHHVVVVHLGRQPGLAQECLAESPTAAWERFITFRARCRRSSGS